MKLDALQTGLYAKLIADAPLMALITGVYADPQQQPESEDRSAFPYVVIGEDVGTSWDTKTDFGTSASVVDRRLFAIKQPAGGQADRRGGQAGAPSHCPHHHRGEPCDDGGRNDIRIARVGRGDEESHHSEFGWFTTALNRSI